MFLHFNNMKKLLRIFTFISLETIKASRESIQMVPINVFFDPFDFGHQIYQIFHPPLSFLYPILQEMIGILKSQWPNLVALSMPTILMLHLLTPLEKISTFTK